MFASECGLVIRKGAPHRWPCSQRSGSVENINVWKHASLLWRMRKWQEREALSYRRHTMPRVVDTGCKNCFLDKKFVFFPKKMKLTSWQAFLDEWLDGWLFIETCGLKMGKLCHRTQKYRGYVVEQKLVPISSLKCDQIYKYLRYDLGHTLLCYFFRLKCFTNPPLSSNMGLLNISKSDLSSTAKVWQYWCQWLL